MEDVKITAIPLCMRYSNSQATKPRKAPNRAPPMNTLRNSRNILSASDQPIPPPSTAIPSSIEKATIAVASLSSDSPSTSTFSRFGAPSSLNRATTATGSVADISAPKTSATMSLISRAHQMPNPTTKVDMSIAGIARIKIGGRSLSICRASSANPDSNMSAGRNINNMISGLRLNPCKDSMK